MKHLRIILASVLLISSLWAKAQNPQEIIRLDGRTVTEEALTVKVRELMAAGKVSGLALAVFNNNEAVYAQTFGHRDVAKGLPLGMETNMYGASLSKAVFAMLVLKLVEEGVLDLDTPLQSYLPKKIYEYEPLTRWHDHYGDLKEDTLYNKITARMALAHTSGFPNWRFFEPDRKLRVRQQPGSGYLYSGEGMVYLQVVIEKMTGRGLEELAQEKVFKPLGMENTGYQWYGRWLDEFARGHDTEGKGLGKDIDNEPRAPSTMETTADDYMTFMEAVLQRKLLSEASYREMFSPQVRIKTKTQFGPGSLETTDENDDIQLSYGLGWGLLQTPYGTGAFKEGHGEGFEHYTIIFPEAGKGIMIMTNSDNGESIFKYLLEYAIGDVYTPWQWETYTPYDQ